MDKRTMDRMYADKKAYVENDLARMLRPFEDFGSIQYARDAITNQEYVKLTETLGDIYFVNVTGSSKAAIGREVCRMALQAYPKGLIRTKAQKREVNRLFV